MTIRVNLSDVDGGSFDPIPSRRYPLNIFDGEIRESGPTAKHPGSSYIAWDFTVAGGDFEGRHIWDNTILTHEGCECGDEELIDKFNSGLFKLKNLLAATGKWSEEELNAPDFGWDLDDVLGVQVAGQVGIKKSDEYGDSNTIKKYMVLKDGELANVGSASDLP